MSADVVVEGVTDPTDWVSTRLPSLQRLDNSLRCQVCKEFLSAPLITECSHTFCSLCIRRCFTQEQKCPSCRVPGQEARLRRNAGVEECVEAFLAVRGELLRVLGEVKEEVGVGIEDVDGMGDMDEMDGEESTPKPVEAVEPEPDDGLFPCPGCNNRMKVDWIPYHIDACLKAKEDGRPPPAPQPPQPRTTRPSQFAQNNQQFFSRPSRTTRSSNTLQPQQPQPQPSTATRLPKLNYSLMNHKHLREKLQEFGLLATGTKTQMVARHSEWVNLYNANLDSLRPKPTRVLVQDLELWEKTVGKDFLSSALGGERRPTKLPGWSDEGWKREHDRMFEDLVKQAREGARK
ncbi:DNA repair protein rad18, partial [Terfezia boudieri ATCC MYA-4762]